MNPKGYAEFYLESRSRPIAIRPDVYQQIVSLARQAMICVYCYQGYTLANPMVVRNVCLGCFAPHRERPPRDLSYEKEVTDEYGKQHGYQSFLFLDSKGYGYVVSNTEDINDNLSPDIAETLRFYGFPVPTTYTLKGGLTVELEGGSAWNRIYGNFQTSPVVIATYRQRYGNHLQATYLLYRDGTVVEFSRRIKKLRTWFDEAKAELEATYQPNQGYIVSPGEHGEDRTAYTLEESHMYPGIVARASHEYTQTHKE